MDGNRVAAVIRANIKSRVAEHQQAGHRVPGLAVLLVGDDPASQIYVKHKRTDCAEVGFASFAYDLPASTSETQLLSLIEEMNERTDVDGILVQLPLPPHIDTAAVIRRIDPDKDVDGFHPSNIGHLMLRMPGLRPCTPRGVITLLEQSGIDLSGRDAVVIGASNTVGRPMALELLTAGCTVTLCHSRTRNLAAHIQRADLVVAAVGKARMVKGEWIKPGAIVVDVGINRLDDGRLVGDVDFDEARKRAAWITPVPGGVGPMTRAMLLQNTLETVERRQQ